MPFCAATWIVSFREHATHSGGCGFCIGFGCEMQAKSSTLYTMIPEAEATGRCEVRPLSYVSRIETNAAGRATGVAYFDKDKREHFQKARAVVLCANGAETSRLLLLSANAKFPDGLANSSGYVGKNLMFNTYAEVNALFEHELNEFKSAQVTRVVHDWYDSDPQRGFYGGGGIDSRIGPMPIAWSMFAPPPDRTWGAGFKSLLEALPRAMIVGPAMPTEIELLQFKRAGQLIRELMDICHQQSAKWWVDIHTGQPIKRNYGELCMLIVSEVSESMEGDRKDLMDDKLPHRPMREVELVDALIRIFDIGGGMDMDLGGAFTRSGL